MLKVDTTYSGSEAANGRKSVRVTSNNTYADGLFIFDVIHTPYGCGTWPALWLTDNGNWPENGEIDVVEAANAGTFGSQSTLHTAKGCSMGVKRKQSGTVDNKDCYYEANDYAGCGVKGTESSYGPEFNSKGGGVSDGVPNCFPIEINSLIPTPFRFTRWNSVTPVFVCGNGSAPIFPPISPREVPTRPPGAKHSQTSPARIATWVLISRTRLSSSISRCVVTGRVRASTTRNKVAVLATAPNSSGTMRLVSTLHTGSSAALRSIRPRDLLNCQVQFSF